MSGIEDKILEQMMLQDEISGMNAFSQREQEKGHGYDYMFDERTGYDKTEYNRFHQSMPFYKEARDKYVDRDRQKFGRLSFEDYVMGLTPEEGYITSLGSDEPSEAALMWNEAFGEDTELMKRAALHYGSMSNVNDYPDKNTAPYQEAKNSYKQGE